MDGGETACEGSLAFIAYAFAVVIAFVPLTLAFRFALSISDASRVTKATRGVKRCACVCPICLPIIALHKVVRPIENCQCVHCVSATRASVMCWSGLHDGSPGKHDGTKRVASAKSRHPRCISMLTATTRRDAEGTAVDPLIIERSAHL
ncbi:hypothetical protein J6590_021148 [Homalodisca vitripennis]|nr:hypothetical protein J6590_021148 [Homalodisca vitripennis]